MQEISGQFILNTKYINQKYADVVQKIKILSENIQDAMRSAI